MNEKKLGQLRLTEDEVKQKLSFNTSGLTPQSIQSLNKASDACNKIKSLVKRIEARRSKNADI